MQIKPMQRHKSQSNKPKRRPLPDHLHTIRIEHEPASTQCACGCQLRRIGEDVSEKLHFRPAQFYKEQHVRGKWVCDQCDTLTQQAMPAYVIDKGIASPECSAMCWYRSMPIICRCTVNV